MLISALVSLTDLFISNEMNKLTIMATAALAIGCCGCEKDYKMGTYGYDLAFFADHDVSTVELKGGDGKSRLLIVPAYQGRVMTSTTDGLEGKSYGWINYKFIEDANVSPQFNPFGGEERFWIGPEGGPFSYYFKKGDEQVYANWKVPAPIDTDTYDIESRSDSEIVFTKDFKVRNASDVEFEMGVRRTISMLDKGELESLLGVEIPDGLGIIAYKTENEIRNKGGFEWTKETGMPSVWLLSTFNPTPSTTVFIPYNKDYAGRKVNDEYFGKVPSDRLVLEDGVAYFKIDGEYRAKIGLPAGSAKDICGSYDSKAGVLNILKYTVPQGGADYVNGQWGEQDDPFSGDVINSYNDGPTETGFVQGPFYEIETSSPAAALAPGQTLRHVQFTVHIEGAPERLSSVAKAVFGVDLDEVSGKFPKQ